MSEYIFKTAIPTQSDAGGIAFDNSLYFASHTNMFKVENNKISIISRCEGTIKRFAIMGNNYLICTGDRIYLNHHENTIGSLKRTATAIASNSNMFVTGVNSILEVWQIPSEYKFTLFKSIARIPGHSKAITAIQILDDNRILTISNDCTVRLFNIKNSESVVVATCRDIPIGLHVLEDKATVTCKDGSIMRFKIHENAVVSTETLGSKIRCSSSYQNLLAVVTDNLNKDTNRNIIILYKDDEEIYRSVIDHTVDEVSLYNYKISLKTKSFIGIYDIQNEAFTFDIDLPKILNINILNELCAAGCADRNIRIYNNHSCIAKLFDKKSKGDLVNAHINKNSCIAVYSSGYVSSFNIADQFCYRSFAVDFENIKLSCISEDGCLLFAADTGSIYVIDMQRSKLIDTLNVNSPIHHIVFYKDFLYSLSFDNNLIKWNVYNGESTVMQVDKMAISFSIKHNVIAIATENEIMMYDIDFNYMDCISVSLESRHRNEIYSKPKPVQCLDFDSNFICCGGQSNTLKIYTYSNKYNNSQKRLYQNELVQKLLISKNKDWENYKSKLGREKVTDFNKNNLIEAKKIVCLDLKFYVLSREGVSIYEINSQKFNPIEFDVDASPQFISESILAQNYSKALVASLQLRDFNLIKSVLEAADDANFLIKSVPHYYSELLMNCVTEILKSGSEELKMAEYIKWIAYYHKECSKNALTVVKDEMKGKYDILRSNYFLLKNILRRKE
jgi:WD40 repeat protein